MDEFSKQESNFQTVAVVHFFTQRTDGVSLQIHENDRVLSALGWNVIECSSDAEGEKGFVLPELDYSAPEVQMFKRRSSDESENEITMERAFEDQVQVIKGKLEELLHHYHPQVFHVRNILSLPIHPVATVAMAEFIAEHPTIHFLAQHHDSNFEDDFLPGDRKRAYEIPFPGIQKRVEKSLLYTAPNVHHAVINSLMQRRLLEEHNIQATIIPDSLDFELRPTEIPNLREKLEIDANDIVFGVMTRIIPRKAIEVAVQFIAALQKRKDELIEEEKRVYGSNITKDKRFVLLLPQKAGLDEPENKNYDEKLRIYAEKQGVKILYRGDIVVADSAYKGEDDLLPFYSLYHAVDVLMYPSYQEGFGNQFLEAVAFGKGVVVAHEYPVMEADILPVIGRDGIISLGNNRQYTLDREGLVHLQEDVLQAAVEREIQFLLHPDEEKHIEDRTYIRLKGAFDAWVVGRKLDALLRSIRDSTPEVEGAVKEYSLLVD